MKQKKWIFNLLLIFFIAVFLISGGFLLRYFLESRDQQNKYNDLASLVEQNRPTTAPTQAESSQPDPTTDNTGSTAPSATTQPVETTEPLPPLVEVTDPDTGKSVLVLREYAQLYQLNNDMVGWIEIPNTPVKYPVVQTPDSPNYYLKRDFYGESSNHGCLYAAEAVNIDAPSDVITIYGHNMMDGSMFHDLLNFKAKYYYSDRKTFTFDTLTEHRTYEIVAVFNTTATVNGFAYHTYTNFADEAAFNEFMSQVRALQHYSTGVEVSYGDKLLCLSTCDFTETNTGRLVVLAKLLP